ncbi:MAG: hypothetical protein JWL59_1659 [Chthoniobacteraceae bacterium]|nr:hypothetical protein [Chthoniobacteraceae bacterium]
MIAVATFAEPAKGALAQKKSSDKPFLILFQSYGGDPTKPAQMTFAVSTLSRRQPLGFAQLGETIRSTNLKLVRFEKKTRIDTKRKKVDQSELTLLNVESNEFSVLVIGKPQNIPSAAK